ncbi:hypothetical protein ACHAWT_009330 [Skeletonema menzelii]
MKCRSPSPPASPVSSNGRGTNIKRRSSASSKLLGSISRVESNSSLPRSGGASANTHQTSQSLMQPLLDDDDLASSSPRIDNFNSTNSFINQRYTTSRNKSNHVEQPNKIQTDLQNLAHRRKLPRPFPPSKCPLLCVFYAEFDIVIGPTVCFQAPNKFMHFDVNVGFDEVQQALEETFQSVKDSQMDCDKNQNTFTSDDYWNWSPNKEKEHNDDADIASQATLPMSGQAAIDSMNIDSPNTNPQSSSGKESKTIDVSSRSGVNDVTSKQSTRHHRSPSYASSSKDTMMSNPTTHEGDTYTIDTELLANSIFAATSEYIITGNELANQTITVSTHGMHILSKPMIIQNTERYERNSHLFAVGFVLRRNVDPRPYWPVLSNLSFTLRDMEVESEFLSNQRTRPQIQYLLEDILLSLNSKHRDCHLLLDDANLLNLRLFRPPPPPTPPVSDYTVPILLRPEWQVQMFDWDLTINWIIPHIDGCKFLKQIAQSSEVDMELVRACLRVLRHHGVLAHVDIFRYSNVYESTPLGKELLNTKEGDNLLREAYFYAAKSKNLQKTLKIRGGRMSGDLSPSVLSSSPFTLTASGRFHPQINSVNSLDVSGHNGSNSFGWASAVTGWARRMEETSSSFPSRTGHLTIAEEEESGDERAPPEKLSTSAGAFGATTKKTNDAAFTEIEQMKNALAQMYASCDRSQSFGEALLEKLSMGNVAFSKKSSTSTQNEILEWKTVFDYFDHRRLITFGVIRGLIKRIHRYPLAYEIGDTHDDTEADNGDPVDAQSAMAASDPSEFDLRLHRKTSLADSIDISVVAAEAATKAQNILDDGSRSRTPSFPASPLLQGISTLPFDRHSKKKPTKKKPAIEAIALAMNGMRCDDELSCMFDFPVEKLIEEVEKSGRWSVISVFSCTN